MADIYYSSPSNTPAGNDTTGDGSITSPYATRGKAISVAASGDFIIGRGGTYNETAAITTSITALTFAAYENEVVTWTGAFTLTLNGGSTRYAFYGINFSGTGSNTGATQGSVYFGGLVVDAYFEGCTFTTSVTRQQVAMRSSVSSALTAKRCVFNYTGAGNSGRGFVAAGNIGMVSISNCEFYKLQYGVYLSADIYICSLESNICVGEMFLGFALSGAVQATYLSITNNTTNLSGQFLAYNSNFSITFNRVNIIFNFINASACIGSIGGIGTVDINGGIVDSNAIVSGTSETGFTNTNKVALADLAAAKFYDTSTNDFRPDIDSPLVLGNDFGDVIGAIGLAHPDVFYTQVPLNKIDSGYGPFKWRERTATHFGTLVAGSGETDVDKVLTTSLVVAGTINPNTVMASNVNGTLPLSAVKASNGGTLPLNKIAPSQGGTYNGSESNDALSASDLVSTVSKLNLGSTVTGNQVVPAAGNVRFGTNTGTTTGTAKIPAKTDVRDGVAVDVSDTGDLKVPTADKVASGVAVDHTVGNRTDADPAYVLNTQPTYGGNGTEFTPSYVPSGGGSETFNKKLLNTIIGVQNKF